MTNSLHQTIKDLRITNGFSQDFMAKKLSISRPTYMQIEKGKRDLALREARTLAEIFGLSLEDFIAEKSPDKYTISIKKNRTKQNKSNHTKEVRISIPEEKVDKFEAVIGYVLSKAGGKPNVGMTVLYKLLYFIDFDYYELFEEQLMGATYIKNHFGPTPLLFGKVVGKMIKDGEVEIIQSKFYKRDQKKYLINPNYLPDLKTLSAREIKHIDSVLEKYSDKTAKDLTDYSHKDVPWITADVGKPLDYEAVFYRTNETSVRQYEDEN